MSGLTITQPGVDHLVPVAAPAAPTATATLSPANPTAVSSAPGGAATSSTSGGAVTCAHCRAWDTAWLDDDYIPDDLYYPTDLETQVGPLPTERDGWDVELDAPLAATRHTRVDELEWELWDGVDQDDAERALLAVEAPAWVFLPPGGELATAVQDTRPRAMSPMALIELLKATGRLAGWTEALKVEAIASFIRQRRAEHAASPRPTQYDSTGRPIDPERSWYAELALALGVTKETIARRADTALRLTGPLRATHTALKCGALAWGKALAIAEATADLPDDAARAVEAHVLKRAASQTHKNLLESLRRQVAKHRAAKEADEHRAATAERTCKIVPLANGMAGLWIVHTADKIQQIWVTIQAMATLAKRATPTPPTNTESDTEPGSTPHNATAEDTTGHSAADAPTGTTATGTTTTGTTATTTTPTATTRPTSTPNQTTPTHTPPANMASPTATTDATVSAATNPATTSADVRPSPTAADSPTATATSSRAGDAIKDAPPPTQRRGDAIAERRHTGGPITGPGQDTRTTEPAQDTRTTEPAQDTRTTEPAQDTRTREPVRDTRTAEQRRADVTADLFEHVLHNGLDWLGRRLPDQHRRRPHIEVVIPASTLLGLDDDPAELTGYGPIPADLARRIAADGTWRRLLTDPYNGTVLEASTTRHDPGTLVTETLLARHPVCAWPGCNRTSRDCDRDHTTPFAQTGTTTLTGLAPYCEYHHVIKDTPAWGWTSTSHPDGSITLTTPTGHRYTTVPPTRGPITTHKPSTSTGTRTSTGGHDHTQPTPARQRIADADPPPF